MTQHFVIGLGKEALSTALKVGAPVLVVSLAIGVAISAFQAVTQVHEASLAFVPKALGIIVVFGFFGPSMLDSLIEYTAAKFNGLPAMAR